MFFPPVNIDRNLGKKTFIYFITTGEYVKVGIALDPDARLKIFQLGNPHEIKISYRRTVDAALALQTEKLIHKALVAHSVGREWFKIDAATAVKIAKPYIDKANRIAQNWINGAEIRAPDVQSGKLMSMKPLRSKAQLKL